MINDPFIKSGLNSEFHSASLSFPAYVDKMRSIIEATRLDLTEENREIIIDANSPFEWNPAGNSIKTTPETKIANGILLVHGLFDSPSTILSIAEYFRQQQFLVRAILLPGHGTHPGDLLGVSYKEWIAATHYGIKSFANNVENLFLCGFSTGGALVLQQSLANKIDNLKGLILIAPAIQLPTPIAVIANFDNLLHRTIGGIKWFTRSIKPDYARYLSFTINSAYQVNLLARIISHLLRYHTVEVPIFLVATTNDEVLSVKAMQRFFSAQKNPLSRFILYGKTDAIISDERLEILNSYFPEKRILNFSHMCLPIAPNHPHYGKHGDYHDISSLEENKNHHDNNKIFLGAVSASNFSRKFMHRLTFNPEFENMIKKLESFLLSIRAVGNSDSSSTT